MFKEIFKKRNKETEEEKNNESFFEKLISLQNPEDKYILDEENAIIVNYSNIGDREFIMRHVRLVNEELVEINRWFVSNYTFGFRIEYVVIKDLHLFKVQNNGYFNALYDYKKDKFVVSQNEWSNLDFGISNSFLEEYNGILAIFSIVSDYEQGDVYSYINPVTGKKVIESFTVCDDNYYAILNIDGSIRKNKLFKGSSFSKIEQIINLDEYESLDEFKMMRKNVCNEVKQKQKQKQKYYQIIEERNNGSISPYLDSEVAEIIGLKLTNNT